MPNHLRDYPELNLYTEQGLEQLNRRMNTDYKRNTNKKNTNLEFLLQLFNLRNRKEFDYLNGIENDLKNVSKDKTIFSKKRKFSDKYSTDLEQMIELPNDRILSQFTYYRFKIGINTYNISNRNRNRLITRDWIDDDTIFCFMSCLSNQYSAKIFVIESFQINNIFECGSLRFNIYEDLSKYALSVIYDNYFDLRAQYLSTVK